MIRSALYRVSFQEIRRHRRGFVSSSPSTQSQSSTATPTTAATSSPTTVSCKANQQINVSHHPHDPSIESTEARATDRPALDLDQNEATALVDRLLSETYEMMTLSADVTDEGTTKITAPLDRMHTIAFSGGVDSSLVAALVFQSKPTTTNTIANPHHHAVQAVMGISPAVPAEQLDMAKQVADSIGIPFVTVPTYEGSNEMYIANAGQACLACKTELYSTLQAVVNHTTKSRIHDSTHHHHHQLPAVENRLYNGTNQDDLQDPTRLGLLAANDWKVRSPLAGIPKKDVRRAARHLGLPNHQTAASPCLRSRLALGVQATRDHLERIERAERFCRSQLLNDQVMIDETTNLRVRLLAGSHACLEIDGGLVEQARAVYIEKEFVWNKVFLDELRFAKFSVRPFKSGSVATRDSSDFTK